MRRINRRWLIFLLAVTLCSISLVQASSNQAPVSSNQSPPSNPGSQPASDAAKLPDLSKLALTFVPNVGQFDAQVRYVAHGPGYTLFLTDQEAVMVISQRQSSPGRDKLPLYPSAQSPQTANLKPQTSVLRYQWQAANSAPQLVAANKLAGSNNYFIGNDKTKWRTDVPSYGRITYQALYPGVDLSYYSTGGQLEYDLTVAPSADASRIRLAVTGAKVEAIAGELVLHTAAGDIRQPAPHIYQNGPNGKQEISGGYQVLADSSIGFRLAAYDSSKPLVIDPSLVYSTFLGGSGTDVGDAIALDSSNNIYVTGYTASPNFPTQNPVQPHFAGGNSDVFISKFTADGSRLVYSTYMGGTGGDDRGWGIAADSAGNTYVAGWTQSPDFPTQNAIQPLYGGSYCDAFVVKLDPAGNLIYSTFLGGSGCDQAWGIAVTPAGAVYVVGNTESIDFPTQNPIQAHNAGRDDVFVTKINATPGTHWAYSTYLGGSGLDEGSGIAVDGAGAAYVTGYTESANFPITNAIQSTLQGSDNAFVTKINNTGPSLAYSTYLGGSFAEGAGIAVDSAGNAYIAGYTGAGFPTVNPVQPNYGGGMGDGFVTRINAIPGSNWAFSSYLGGSGFDHADAIAADNQSHAYVAGTTWSNDFPNVNPLQPNLLGGQDAFVANIDTLRSGFKYSTFLGGTVSEYGSGIKVDSQGNAYVTGFTSSPDFPIVNAFQPRYAGAPADVYVSKISPRNPTPTPTGTPPTATPTIAPTNTPVNTCPNQFLDVSGNVFYNAIHNLNCRGVVSGTDASHFSPAGTATRGQFARTVVKGFGLALMTPNGGTQDFTDVPPGYFAYLYIESGYHAGILSGFDAASCVAAGATPPCYLPSLAITRAQTARLVVKAAGYAVITPAGGPTFVDVPPGYFAFAYIQTAATHNIIRGVDSTHFQPDRNIRRDEMAQIVYTAVSLP